MRALLSLALAASLAAACDRGRRDRPGIPPRQVLLVTVDGLRADHVSAWNYPRPTTELEIAGTPRAQAPLSVDRLAEEGVIFARAFAPSTEWQVSLAALHTGRSPLAVGSRRGVGLAEEEVTLAETFSAAGFETRAFVSAETVHLGPGWSQGFDTIEECVDDLDAVQRVLAWIAAHDFGSGGRAFVWLHLSGPAFPYEPGKIAELDFARLYADPDYGGAARGDAAFRDERVELTDADRAHIAALYDGEIARTTHLLRRLLDWLAVAGGPSDAWPGTLLALAGLGGETLAPESSGELGDRTLPSEGALHVPLFLRHPDSLTGRRIFARLVTLEDLFPTLVEWFALPVPDDVQGESLLSLTDEWRHRPFPDRTLVALGASDDAGHEALSARDERWRLVIVPPRSSDARLELHDLASDPRARRDVSAEHPDVAEQLRAELRAAASSLDLPWLR